MGLVMRQRLSTSFNTAIILQLGKRVSEPEYEHHYMVNRKKDGLHRAVNSAH